MFSQKKYVIGFIVLFFISTFLWGLSPDEICIEGIKVVSIGEDIAYLLESVGNPIDISTLYNSNRTQRYISREYSEFIVETEKANSPEADQESLISLRFWTDRFSILEDVTIGTKLQDALRSLSDIKGIAFIYEPDRSWIRADINYINGNRVYGEMGIYIYLDEDLIVKEIFIGKLL